MPDISLCLNKSCLKKETCYRYKAKPSEFRQVYAAFTYDEDGNCEDYWEMKDD